MWLKQIFWGYLSIYIFFSDLPFKTWLNKYLWQWINIFHRIAFPNLNCLVSSLSVELESSINKYSIELTSNNRPRHLVNASWYLISSPCCWKAEYMKRKIDSVLMSPTLSREGSAHKWSMIESPYMQTLIHSEWLNRDKCTRGYMASLEAFSKNSWDSIGTKDNTLDYVACVG